MSQRNHLKKIVQILRDNFDHDIKATFDWSWNLKNWTINFISDYDYENVTAYRVKDNVTQWNDFIVLEKRKREWVNLL